MSVFYVKTVKIRRRLGATSPDPLCQIWGATQTLHIIFAYYSCVNGAEMKDTNSLTLLIRTSFVIIAAVCESARF